MKKIKKIIEESILVKKKIIKNKAFLQKIIEVGKIIANALKAGKCIFVFGNGGSAADAQHFVAELIGRFKKFKKERKALKAIALTTNTSILTAVSNDWSFEKVFERQLEALCSKGDIVIGISTSGQSMNIIKAVKKAREIGAITIVLACSKITELDNIAEFVLHIPSMDTPRIQEAHITILHILMEIIEDEMQKQI